MKKNFKYIISFFFLWVSVLACSQKKEEIMITQNPNITADNIVEKLGQEKAVGSLEPLYEIEIKTFHCSLELWVNDILVFNHFEENGSVWVDWPINQYIIESGVQNFELRLFPYKNQKLFSSNAQVELGIRARNEKTESRIDLIERDIINIPNKESLPMYVYKGVFNADVPYKLLGWKNSLNLKDESESSLLDELLTWNNKLLDIYKTSNISEYKKVYKAREEEFDKAYYIFYTHDDDVFHSKFKNLIALPNKNYKLNFYAQGRLASVKLPYKLPGFTYEPEIKDEESLGISLIIFFHRREKGMPLEIIR